jgi:7-cyano-7-deazaguanine synthase in queuosine biosynthesis
MPKNSAGSDASAALFPRRNLILFVVALATIAAGYVALSGGSDSAEAASVLLVAGYCVLLPLSLLA